MSKYSAEQAGQILQQEKEINFNLQEEPLRTVQRFFNGIVGLPEGVQEDSPAGVVFLNLCVCYQNQGNVSEGLVNDIIYGFAQSGIPKYITIDGFKELQKLNVVEATDRLGTHLFGDITPASYFKWTRKFFGCLIPHGEKKVLVDEKRFKDTTVDKLTDD